MNEHDGNTPALMASLTDLDVALEEFQQLISQADLQSRERLEHLKADEGDLSRLGILARECRQSENIGLQASVSVIPAKAGTRNPVAGKYAFAANGLWIPAFAGMTVNMTTLPNRRPLRIHLDATSFCFRAYHCATAPWMPFVNRDQALIASFSVVVGFSTACCPQKRLRDGRRAVGFRLGGSFWSGCRRPASGLSFVDGWLEVWPESHLPGFA